MQNPKVLFISSFTIPEQSGSGIHAFRFCRFLVRSGYRAYILSFNRHLKYSKIKIVDGVKIIRIPYLNKNLLLKIISLPVILSYYLIHLLKTDVVYIYGNKIIGYQAIILFSYLLNKEIIFRSLLSGVDDFETIMHSKSLLKRKINKFILKNISVYHAINPIFINNYKKYNFKKIKLLESVQGVDLQYFKPVSAKEKKYLREIHNLPKDKFIIIAPAILINRKGFRELFFEMSKLTTNFLLLVIGLNSPVDNFLRDEEIKEMSELKNLGNNLLKDKIVFVDPIKKINLYMQMADLLVLNSKNEGMPNVILEAMASGLPVLCRKLPGILDEIIQNGKNGFTYTTMEEFHKKLLFAIENEPILSEIGNKERQFAEKKLSFEIVIRKILNLLDIK